MEEGSTTIMQNQVIRSTEILNNLIIRFKNYKKLGYNIEVIYTHLFEEAIECKEFETSLKRLIKNNLYSPKKN